MIVGDWWWLNKRWSKNWKLKRKCKEKIMMRDIPVSNKTSQITKEDVQHHHYNSPIRYHSPFVMKSDRSPPASSFSTRSNCQGETRCSFTHSTRCTNALTHTRKHANCTEMAGANIEGWKFPIIRLTTPSCWSNRIGAEEAIS